jgi:acetyltransferase-like isoleucine patch superfamily enzyme
MNSISASAKISALADIETSVKGSKLIIGDNVLIDSFVKIKFTGGLGDVIIGNDSFLNSGCVIYSGNGVSIGKNVLVAANCTFAAVNHAFENKNELICLQGFLPSKGGIIIEDDVWIGANVTILDGAIIRKGAVIGANSFVNKEVEQYSVNAGNPLKQIGSRK